MNKAFKFLVGFIILLSTNLNAQIKISELSEFTSIPTNAVVPIVINGATKKYMVKKFVLVDSTYNNPNWLTGLAPNKLLQAGATTGQSLIWNGSNWVAGSSVSRFDHNVVVNIPGGSLGAFSNGQTIPLNGKRVDSLPDILATKCVLPTYVAPTAGISASPSNGSYERGTNLGTITLSSSFTQNNGGSNTTTTYYQNDSPLGGNTTTISSLTSTQSFYVNKAYLQGACIADNCGAIECIGRINAGSVNSGTISFTPFDKRYWGFISSTAPSNSVILALSQDNNGSTGSLTLSNVTPSGSQYLAYFTKGSVSSVVVNGIPATGAFTFTTYSVTNAQNLTQTYTYVYSNNPQTSTLNSVIFN